jgi:hypothetical protein
VDVPPGDPTTVPDRARLHEYILNQDQVQPTRERAAALALELLK